MNNKCPKCGFPEHGFGELCPVVAGKLHAYTVPEKPAEFVTGLSCDPKHYVFFDPPPSTQPSEPSLSLLVIDAGECCFVQIKHGRADFKLMPDEIGGLGYRLIPHPFPELRAAIDAHFAESKPLPRIEYNHTVGEGDDKYIAYKFYGSNSREGFVIDKDIDVFNALARQVGATKDLEIYEPKGTWTQAFGGIGKDAFNDVADIALWIYER